MDEYGIPALAEVVAPSRAALVVIDVQNDFTDPASFPRAEAILPMLQRLLAVARAAGVPVIYTQSVSTPATEGPVWRSRFARRPRGLPFCREGTPGADFHSAVTPQPGDIVVVKHRYSAFHGTDFELILRSQAIDSLVFTGITTNGCVESSVRDAFQRELWTTTVADCTAAASDDLHEGALRSIAWNFGRVVSSADVLALWQPVARPLAAPATTAGR
jgi:ureidoacrylate peracid hydrolase